MTESALPVGDSRALTALDLRAARHFLRPRHAYAPATSRGDRKGIGAACRSTGATVQLDESAPDLDDVLTDLAGAFGVTGHRQAGSGAEDAQVVPGGACGVESLTTPGPPDHGDRHRDVAVLQSADGRGAGGGVDEPEPGPAPANAWLRTRWVCRSAATPEHAAHSASSFTAR
jgi:hypothetical protein